MHSKELALPPSDCGPGVSPGFLDWREYGYERSTLCGGDIAIVQPKNTPPGAATEEHGEEGARQQKTFESETCMQLDIFYT